MRRIFVTAIALAAAPLQAQPSVDHLEAAPAGQEGDQGSQADDVRFSTDLNDRMTVAVHLAGAGPFRFLVDTGADRTAISSDLAERLALKAGETAPLHTVTGKSLVETAIVPGLQLSRSAVTVVDAPVLESRHIGADGILGTDTLRSQRVVFDFENRTMSLIPASLRVPREDGTIVVTGRLRNGRLILTNAIADDNRITAVIDSGSEVTIGNEALRRRLDKRGLLKNSGVVRLQSVTGDILLGEYVFLRKLELGDVTLANLAVVFADAHTFKQLGLEKRPAILLGMNALKAFKKVSIDFANRKFRVILPEQGSLQPAVMAARQPQPLVRRSAGSGSTLRR